MTRLNEVLYVVCNKSIHKSVTQDGINRSNLERLIHLKQDMKSYIH
jgi:hypothetical protein